MIQQGFDEDADRWRLTQTMRQHPVAGPTLSRSVDHAERRVGSGDQDKDHHMVHFLQNPVDMGGNIEGE